MRLYRMFNVNLNLDLNLIGLANTNDHEFTRIISSVGAAGTWLC